ncbi:unnamed protein product [Arctia plantaginis]|uniref:C2H2-type domain-containing protein n=1 Tax=Arctia plantaginis TaxID=874455 RepID=A0A8S0ZYW8_ARCPL|nr:unnamed protein product [Arctia plantaginis]
MDSLDESEGKEIYIDIEPEEMTNYAPDADTTCTICHAEFLDPEDLNIHLDQVHKIARSVLKKCQLCPEAYTDMMDYAEHIRDNHLLTLKCCSLCWRVFEDFDAHRIHHKKHSVSKSDSIYSCSQCQQKYADLFSLRKHEFEHKNSKDGVLMHDAFPYLSVALKVKSITFISTLDTDVVYVCVGCGFSTVDMTMYLRHVRSNKCEVYVCHTCGNVFNQKRNLIKHLSRECNMFGEREKKTRLCLDCNTHIAVRTYQKHKTFCKPIKCHSCNITFKTMNEWSDHQSQKHAGHCIEVETCQFCWKRCVGRVAMQKHIDKTHRPMFHLYKYLCIYCKSVFNHPQKLFAHFVTKHKDIFPYTCKICNKKFRFRKKFTIHIKLEHKSVGFVEFDENYHVFFSDKKSETPFVPKSIIVDESKTSSDERATDIIALNSDFTDALETEGNQTEIFIKETSKLKRKKTTKTRKQNNQELIMLESSDDDEPLHSVRKRVRLQKKSNLVPVKKRRLQQTNRKALTCNICEKYCYTVQNYNHHVSLHSKHEVKKCIKCSKIFRSKAKLNEHVATVHSSSRLTETLKILLEKRKTGGSLTEDLPTSVKFQRTLVKAKTDITTTSAKITVVDHKLSVQKFFENFVPEESKEAQTESTATIKLVTGYARERTVKMTKFKNTPISTSQRLAMPVKFVDHYPDKTKVSIKIVEAPCEMDDAAEHYSDHCDDNGDMDRHEAIPEVAEEVMLENTEESPRQKQNEVAHKIVIPKLPTELTDIRIAHLLPAAPYYKIVKVKDVLAQNDTQNMIDTKPPTSIKLSDGTKLVTTNPLAHLLGKNQEEVLKSVKNKYYKSKNQNFQALLSKALTRLEKPTYRKKREVRNIEVETDEN